MGPSGLGPSGISQMMLLEMWKPIRLPCALHDKTEPHLTSSLVLMGASAAQQIPEASIKASNGIAWQSATTPLPAKIAAGDPPRCLMHLDSLRLHDRGVRRTSQLPQPSSKEEQRQQEPCTQKYQDMQPAGIVPGSVPAAFYTTQVCRRQQRTSIVDCVNALRGTFRRLGETGLQSMTSIRASGVSPPASACGTAANSESCMQ